MLPFVLALTVLGVSFALIQSQFNSRDDDRRDLAPVRVRADEAPVLRRRSR